MWLPPDILSDITSRSYSNRVQKWSCWIYEWAAYNNDLLVLEWMRIHITTHYCNTKLIAIKAGQKHHVGVLDWLLQNLYLLYKSDMSFIVVSDADPITDHAYYLQACWGFSMWWYGHDKTNAAAESQLSRRFVRESSSLRTTSPSLHISSRGANVTSTTTIQEHANLLAPVHAVLDIRGTDLILNFPICRNTAK